MNKILSWVLLIFFYLATAAVIYFSLFSFALASQNLVGLLCGLLFVAIAIASIATFKKVIGKRMDFGIIFLFFVVISVVVSFFSISDPTPKSSHDAKIESYLDQMRTSFSIYYDSNENSYIGADEFNDYILLRGKIGDIYENRQIENPYSSQIKEKEYCVRAKLLSKEAHYWCIDSKGYEGEATDQYCTAEKPYCAE